VPRSSNSPPKTKPTVSGSAGWDDYAAFYDWENAQTMARRDVPFWRRVALAAEGPVLELGCGTGRVTLPIARAGVPVIGIDLSSPMLQRAATFVVCRSRPAPSRWSRRRTASSSRSSATAISPRH
jgi:SAM-dependent methyltransferase